ncbi:MAG TPA: metallophosphoesterase family protein [Anaeromyxobacteraceae bacterium]|nr:metallophosphoesterase family protein [Anaeromyxobacteraceae bacterium]
MRAAFFGGVYSNWLALEATLRDARRRGAEAVYCLGDLGAFGPHPDRSIETLRAGGIPVVQGNYDDAVGSAKPDCGCGYTYPRDDHFARLSYAYTLEHTSGRHRPWLAGLPARLAFEAEGKRYVMVHGSPRRQNEFLWETGTPDHLLDRLAARAGADVLLCTHTGLHWRRALPSGRQVVNVGAIGRPANDGRTNVWYVFLDTGRPEPFQFVPVAYDHERLAREMRQERLPDEFVETILSGWWTTCLEILPHQERLRGRY